MSKAPVLVSYSSLDQPLAEKVLKALRSKNIACWAAMDGIRPGESWPAAISEAINQCEVFVLILTKNANISRQVVRELTQADNHNKRLYCFQAEDMLISKDLQYFFSSTQRLEAFKMSFEKAISEMASDLKNLVTASSRDKPVEPVVNLKKDEEQDYWKKVISTNDAEEYLDYLTRYPNGKYKQEANNRLNALHEKTIQEEITEPDPYQDTSSSSKKKTTIWIVSAAIVVVLIIIISYSLNRPRGEVQGHDTDKIEDSMKKAGEDNSIMPDPSKADPRVADTLQQMKKMKK